MKVEAYVYEGEDLICADCYQDPETTKAQRKKCEPVFDPQEDFQEKPTDTVNCAWCGNVIVEATEEEADEEDDEEDDEEEENGKWYPPDEDDDQSLDSDPYDIDSDKYSQPWDR